MKTNKYGRVQLFPLFLATMGNVVNIDLKVVAGARAMIVCVWSNSRLRSIRHMYAYRGRIKA